MPQHDDPGRESSPTNSSQPPSFEEGLAHLADLVNRLEGGGLGLSESIAAYERGVAILRGLHEELTRAEERIRVLTAVDAAGLASTEPFPGANAANPTPEDAEVNGRGDQAGKAASRGAARRKASRPATLPGMDDFPAEA